MRSWTLDAAHAGSDPRTHPHDVRERVIPLKRLSGERGSFVAIEPDLREARAIVKKQGLWAPQLPKELGGMGLSLIEHARVSEELGRSPLGHYVFGCQAPDAGNMEILHSYGTDEQKEHWLEPLVARRDPQLLLDDRARSPGLEPDVARDDGAQGRRRLRHQRPQVVHHGAPTAPRSPSSWR